MGRPKIANPSKDALWKRAQRAGTRANRCSRCGKRLDNRDGIQHHRDGVLKNEGNRRTLCRSCHAAVDNPMKTALGKRANIESRQS